MEQSDDARAVYEGELATRGAVARYYGSKRQEGVRHRLVLGPTRLHFLQLEVVNNRLA